MVGSLPGSAVLGPLSSRLDAGEMLASAGFDIRVEVVETVPRQRQRRRQLQSPQSGEMALVPSEGPHCWRLRAPQVRASAGVYFGAH